MQSRTWRSLWLCLAICTVASEVSSANLCDVKDTRNACLGKWEKALTESVERTNKDAALESGKAHTGLSNASSELPTSSFTDFFNTLNAAANTGGSSNDDPQTMGFELNHCGFPALPGQSLRCQVRARAEKPQIYGPLQAALQSGELGERVTQIEDGLGVGDKATGGIFLSWVNDRFGRELTPDNNRLFQELQDEAEQHSNSKVAAARNNLHAVTQAYSQYLQNLVLHRMAPAAPAAGAADDAAAPLSSAQLQLAALITTEQFTFAALPDDLEQEALGEFEKLASALVDYTDTRSRALLSTQYFQLANLLDNQPQPLLGAEYGAASDFAGPDEFRAKVSIESGLVNVNSFRKYRKNECPRDAEAAASTAVCLNRYLSLPAVQAALTTSTRWAATLEYVKRRRYDVSVPDTVISISEQPVRSWIGSLSFGRYLHPFEEQSQLTRIDVVASYEDVSDDPQRQDRGIGSATLSRQLSKDWVLAVGLVYATEPEFRAAADKDLSLRLGLNYKILRNPGQ